MISTPLNSRPSILGNMPASSPSDQHLYEGGLAARIEEQRAKIRALELEAEERRQADRLRLQERHQEQLARTAIAKESSRQQRLARKARQAVSPPLAFLHTPQMLDEGFEEQIKATLQERRRRVFQPARNSVVSIGRCSSPKER
jgi:hypothetical protein